MGIDDKPGHGVADMQRESVPSRLNLAHHRVIARVLESYPSLINEARTIVDAWARDNPFPLAFVKEWQSVISAPLSHIRHKIVSKTSEGAWLRGNSPFALLRSRVLTREQVCKFWRFAAFHAMRPLDSSEYHDYADHLKMLDKTDRYLRFSKVVEDEWIDRFVEGVIRDRNSVIIAHYDPHLSLDGAAHVCLVERNGQRYVDMGLSVVPQARHRGIGYHLLQRGLLWARNRGGARLWSVCATDNLDMQLLAQEYNMKFSTFNNSIEAMIESQPVTADSVALELLEDQVGIWDYQAKAQQMSSSLGLGHSFLLADRSMDLSRLMQLVAFGRTDLIASYFIVVGYVLTQTGVSAEDHVACLAELRTALEPLVAHGPDLSTFIKGLPLPKEKGKERKFNSECPGVSRI